MNTQNVRSLRPLIAFALLLLVSCSGNNPPDVTILQYGSAVVEASTQLQKAITASTDAKTISVPLAQKLTGYMDVVYAKSGTLGEAVKSYHALSDLNMRKLKAAEIMQLVSDIDSSLGKLLAENLPEGALRQLTLLAGNVLAAVAQVQLVAAEALAK